MSWKKNLIVGASVAGAATLTIHLINKFVYFSATLDNLLSNPSGSYYNWKFGNIYYTKSGKGKPVLLIHNLSTFSSGYEWHPIKEKLAKTNTVYCIDLLGCGRSDKPNLIYTNYLYVQLITDFIKRVIGEKCDVIASGESGSFAVAACQNDPEIIDQIVMVNPSDIHHLAKSPSKRTKTLTRLINTPVFGTFLYNILTGKKKIRSVCMEKVFYHKDIVSDGMVDTFFETAHSGNASSKYLFASLCGRYTTVDVKHCLKDLNNSIFILTGDKIEEKEETSSLYKEILPSIEIEKIKDTKYLPQMEDPEQFLDVVQTYLL